MSETKEGSPAEEGTTAKGGAQGIATAIAEVSERATLLIHEEIELAKAEVAERVSKLVKGAVVGVAAGVFFVMALVFALVGCAWLLYYYLPGKTFAYFWGFFAMAVILLLLGALAGFIAARVVKRGSPPVPKMAIEEARKIRETVSAGADAGEQLASTPHPSTIPPAGPVPVHGPVPAAGRVPAAGPEGDS